MRCYGEILKWILSIITSLFSSLYIEMSEWAAASIVASSPPDTCMTSFFKTDIITFPAILS